VTKKVVGVFVRFAGAPPQIPDLDEDLFVKIKNDFVAARQIREKKKRWRTTQTRTLQ
jgi:hypothetical protein